MNDGPPHEVPAGSFPDVVPVLTDGRVRLRPMTDDDLPAVVIIDLRPSAKGDAWETGFVLHPGFTHHGTLPMRIADRTDAWVAALRPGLPTPDGSVGPALHWERLAQG